MFSASEYTLNAVILCLFRVHVVHVVGKAETLPIVH